MARYIVRRVGQAILTLYTVFTLTFLLIRFLPGGPMAYLRAQVMKRQRGSDISQRELNTIVESYTNIHPDLPLHVQYFNYLSSLTQGDFGKSFWFQKDVGEIIFSAIPWTVFLLSMSILLTFAIGIVSGAIMAYHEGQPADYVPTFVMIIFNSIPYYVVAILGIYVLGYQMNIFPAGGELANDTTTELSLAFFFDALYHAALPVMSLVITGIGGVAITMRGNAIQVLGEDYINVAHLRGVPDRHIALKYVGRNAILPMYTNILISIGFMFGGAVILEEIFTYKGIGYYLITAVRASDYPLLMGTFNVIMVAVVLALLIADLTYGKIDPRISGGDSRESH